uniref:M16 family metallopeptidase n=1 Tax=Thaumasiovibrio occultus TaxID=1891184 RepID=UPI000B35D35C|nr:pitrilysin family protein [Thaumasiovibrio occultus]
MLLLSLGLTACAGFELTKSPTLPEGITLVEARQFAPDEVGISFEKYQLANGLTVILHPDHSDPLVHVDVTYHVGSAREEEGYSGFSHFFEHMMFQGSEHVGDQQHFRMITEAGGTMNGTTNRDRTNYFQTVPANELEKVLWLEADRMGFLLDAVSQDKFEIQRDTVKNERAQRYENRPYGLMYERMGEALYPREHPYSWQTIGYVEDLDRVDVDDLKAFFLRWYGPNNAVLTIGGDIDTQTTLEWVNKYFGSIPTGPEVVTADKWPVTLPQDRFITLEDRVQQPMLLMAWPTEFSGSEDEYALDILARVMGGGRNGLLYQMLVKPGRVLDAGAFQDCAELSCTFYVYAMGNSGEEGNLAAIRQEVMAVLAAMDVRGVTEQDLNEVKGMVEASTIYGLQSVSGKVSQLASNETFYGEPDRLAQETAAFHAVTTQDVERVFKQYILAHPSVSLSTVPMGRTDLAAAEPNYQPAPRVIPEAEAAQLDYRRAVDDFDRSVVPTPTAPVTVTLPELYRETLANGIEVLGTVNRETPTVQLQLTLPAGRRDELPSQSGLAELTAALMNEASRDFSAEQLQAELDALGSQISFSAATYTTTMSVSSLTEHLDETLLIAATKLWEPAFNQADFERLRQQMIEGLLYEQQSPDWQAGQATRELLFKGTPFALPSGGTPESLAQLTLDDVKAFYKENYTSEGAKLVVVGDITPEKLTQKLRVLGTWEGPAKAAYPEFTLPTVAPGTVWLVDMPNAPQSAIRLLRPAKPYDTVGEMYQTKLANFNLGGNFNSRINQNLREDKGYTYGAGGYVVSGREVGYINYYANVRADATAPALAELIGEMHRFNETGVSPDELAFLRLAVGQSEALSYETPSQKASLLSQMQTYGLSEDYIAQQNALLASIDAETLNAMAQKWLDPQDYHYVVVGDATRLKPQLESLGLPVRLLSPTLPQ